AASLCYSFTVGKSGSGSWWNKVQGQLNEETFLSYKRTNNCHANGALENRLNVTKICEKQVDILKDGGDLLKAQMSPSLCRPRCVVSMKQMDISMDPGTFHSIDTKFCMLTKALESGLDPEG
ncbi:hypothetical protein A6R68_00969, partial [Neotoma lepida]